MRAAAFLFCVAALGALPSPCLAAEGDSIAPRLGFALGGLYGQARNEPRVEAYTLDPILQVELGVKFDRHLGVYALGEAGTIIFAAQAAAYAVVEWTPFPVLALGTGIGGDAMAGGGGGSCESTCPDGGFAGFSIPLIVGIDVARLPRGALRLDLEAAGGFDHRTSTYGWHTAFTFGWVMD
ncbi:MAG: hypothetical protein ACRENE_18460, partial [Polyangiaceae bacterium]